ncbi:hypothetical protein SDC9_111877 [bioreactor metagenome]|uniref:Uncharacterized protein n=1 Tax=bioreactor metagenome TaxID=1076179 RepID=A0A645BHX8_9ZZZZ
MNANLKKLPALSALAALTVSMFLLAGCSAGSSAGASSSPSGSPAALSPSPSASASPSASPAATEEAASSVVYQNEEYGFDFTLPESWKGYTVVTDKWDGTASDSQGEKTVATGPELLLRHPSWKTEKPRQDIPIMVFTLDEWDKLQKDEFHIGAAPIGPSELGRNSKYVFALPARYNFAFLEGYEEVETILSGGPLVPTENFGK